MARHHIIPRYEWKKRFGRLVGFNAEDNVVDLTTEQHAQVHLLLYEINGNEYDMIAFRAITGSIGKEEILKAVVSATQKGRKRSLETRRKMSIVRKGRKFSEEHKRNLGLSHMGNKSNTGRTISPEARKKCSDSQRERWRLKRLINSES